MAENRAKISADFPVATLSVTVGANSRSSWYLAKETDVSHGKVPVAKIDQVCHLGEESDEGLGIDIRKHRPFSRGSPTGEGGVCAMKSKVLLF